MARILIVEDNAALRKIYVSVLTKEGYEVEFAGDGQEALIKAINRPPDLVLLDVMMPTLDGIGFLRAFDVKKKYSNTKVIMFSNTEQQEKVQEATQLGAVRYLSKYNHTPKVVAGVIKEVLAGS